MTMENYHWRPIQDTDLAALAELDAACRAEDGPASVGEPSYETLLGASHTALLGATREGDPQIVAVGWVQVNGAQARLGGRVHPAVRRQGLGTHLLRWSETQAGALGTPATLVIRNEALNKGSAALYAQEGYARDFTENWMQNWMQRPLRDPVPAPVLPLPTVTWTAETAPQFYAAYYTSFATRRRPDTPAPPAEEWIAAYADDPDFRPDLSLLALDGDRPVGFIAAGVLHLPHTDQPVGWVSQVGVDPAWRGRGLGAALMGVVLAGFQREGFAVVGLHVNIDNPNAIALYERLGFQLVGRRAKYSKPYTP
jgi:ribosomal protein S18 acetylase RimI-like enzyme